MSSLRINTAIIISMPVMWVIKVFLPVLNFLFLTSCGIKKEPKPLPEPEYKLLRLGSYIYVIPKKGGINVEGFDKFHNFFVKKNPLNICFKVKHVEGKIKLECVEKAITEVPPYSLEITEEEVVVRLLKEGEYKLYRVETVPIPTSGMKVNCCEVRMKREFMPKKVALTRVVGNRESQPAIIEVPPKAPPEPSPPEKGGYKLRGKNLYIYWWMKEDRGVTGFFVYKNGRRITPEPITANVFRDEAPSEPTVYEVRSVNKFGVESKPLKILYKP